MNTTFNDTIGQRVGPGFFPAGDSPQVKTLTPLISGDFTGTTEEILRWAACKWGISQDIVFAQAAVESWWRQSTLGDWGTEAKFCPPGHGLGTDGRPGECPQSYGILQNRYPYEEASWPGIGTSTAMNADAAYAIWRSCYDGYEVWLNNEPGGSSIALAISGAAWDAGTQAAGILLQLTSTSVRSRSICRSGSGNSLISIRPGYRIPPRWPVFQLCRIHETPPPASSVC